MRGEFKVLVLLLAAFLSSGDAQQCTIACPRSLPTTVAPKVESTYVYSVETKTLLTPRDSQKVTIKADAEVAVKSVCESVLRLRNVVIEGVPNGAELATQLQVKPFAFGYFNGMIRGVCSAKDEEEWALNIKKAIVSALQVSSNSDSALEVDEADFSGNCPTSYRRLEKSADGAVVIEKKKELNRCHDRRVDLRQTPDQALGQFKELVRQYLHPVNSDLTCKVTLKDLVVSGVECEEQHTLVHRQEKPIHISSIKLALKETKAGIAGDFSTDNVELKEVHMTFDHKHKNPSEADVVEVLKKLCSEVSGRTASIESSFTFQKLVDKLRYLSTDETASVDQAVNGLCAENPKRLRQLFLDASAFAASDGSIQTLVKAQNNKEISVARATLAFTVVALKAAPKESTVQALLPLIKSSDTPRPLLLGLSVLVRRYCEKSKDCDNNAGLKVARDAFIERLGKATDNNDKLTAIKAIENLNVHKDEADAVKVLDDIINSKDAEPIARAAAVQALPNEASHNDHFKSIVLEESNPNEVRIAAFQKLARNSGLKNVKEFMGVKEHCIKNYVLSYVKNLKNSKNQARKSQLPADVELTEQPQNTFGITRHVAREYGPLTFEYDIIYPKDSNVTRSINARVTRSAGGKVSDVVEIQLYQDGLNRQVGNILNVLARKMNPVDFGMETVKDIMQFIEKVMKKDHLHNHLKISVKINGKNVMFTDVFEDACTIGELLKKRFERIVGEKKIDQALGGVLIDSKVVVPTITGLPIVYKVNDNFVLHINAEFGGEPGKRNVKLARSAIIGIHAAMKLMVKDNKLGYEYDAKLGITPVFNVDIERKDGGVLFRLNVANLEKHTLVKFKQALREVKSGEGAKDIENELAPEPRSDACLSFFILNYCRKESQIKGLKIPNIEYYVVKPEKSITAIELELKYEMDNTAKRFIAALDAVGSSTNKKHEARIDLVKSSDTTRDLILTLKSPENSFESKLTLHKDGPINYNLKMDFPHVISVDVTAKSEKDKETNTRKNQLDIEYKLPGDDKAHKVHLENEIGLVLKRSAKEKVASLDYKSKFTSSRRPFLNHRSAIQLKYRPLKLSEINLEFDYGENFDHKYKLLRNSNIQVEEMKPFKMSGNSDIQILSTDFDVDYDLKSEMKYQSNKGLPGEFLYKIKGKDRSKRAAAGGNQDVEAEINYKNKGSPIDSKLVAQVNMRGNKYGYESELKQVDQTKFEGKITITNKDKKIFITHKDEFSRPVDNMRLKVEAEVTYSDKPDKKNYLVEYSRDKEGFVLKGNVKRNGQIYADNDLKVQKNGKLKWHLQRDFRTYDLDLDNVFQPKSGTFTLKVRDRVYNFKLDREPFRYSNIQLEGNDKAYIKKGNAHLSLFDPITLNLLTKQDSKLDLFIDLISPTTKKATLKIDSPKYKYLHDGSVEVQLINPRILLKSHTKKDTREYKLDADIARKGSLVTFQRVTPERTSNVKYARNGDKINLDLDTSFIEGKVEGDRRSGKIHLKNKEKSFELESTYKVQNGKLVIESVNSNNAKLDALLSVKEPSHLDLETPSVKAHLKADLISPVKTFNLDYDSPRLEKKIDALYEPNKRYKYSSHGKFKESNREHHLEVEGIPKKQLNVDLKVPNFEFKIEKPESSNKAKFTYTLNDYTESEEYEFDPHRPYLINWLRAVRLYLQSFIVE